LSELEKMILYLKNLKINIDNEELFIFKH
jgi:hypothetical protein